MSFFRQQATRVTAVLFVLITFGLTRLPQISATERQTLAQNFHFTTTHLPQVAGPENRTIRPVHPSLQRIASWISSVGAAVALNDLDGDGLSNDVCYVDVRTDQVIITPAPGTSTRYTSFALNQPSDLYTRETMAPIGCLPNDMNEDGHVDLLVYYWGRTPIAYLNQSQSLSPASFTAQAILPGDERWFTDSAAFADIDNDGHADLIIGNYFQDGAAILDVNGDVTQVMQHSMSRALNGGKNRILLWQPPQNGQVRFFDAPGLDDVVAHGWTLALGAADLDGDMRPEIYFANDFGPDRLLHNLSTPGHLQFALLEGQRGFTTPKSKVVGQDGFKGMGIDFADVNGDGRLDMYVSNITSEFGLQESQFLYLSTGQTDQMAQGIAPYTDESEPLGLSRSGWSWEARLDDFNNDGVDEALQATGFVAGQADRWPELHELAMSNDELLTHPLIWPELDNADISGHEVNPFFVRASNGRYYNLAAEIGIDTPQVSRGIATADVDGDGDLDFAVANEWSDSVFYLNDCPKCGAYLNLHLLIPVQDTAFLNRPGHPAGDTLGYAAIGATVTVHLPDGRSMVAQVDGGNGHSGERAPELHFGLGDLTADTLLTVDVVWRDSQGQLQQKTIQLQPGWHTLLLGTH